MAQFVPAPAAVDGAGILPPPAGDPGLLAYRYPLRVAFVRHLKQMFSDLNNFGVFLTVFPQAIVIGYIASRSNDAALVTYITIGMCLLAAWTAGVFYMGWSLSDEIFAGTLDFMLTARTPLMVVLFGKALALELIGLAGGLVASGMVLAFSGFHLTVANVPALLLAGVVSLFALVAASFAFAPLSVLAGARGGFFSAIMTGGVVFSGFVYPATVLPGWMQVIAWPLPTARAMAAIHGAIDGAPFLNIALDLLFSLLLSGVFLWFTAWLFQKVEYRVRVTGALRGG